MHSKRSENETRQVLYSHWLIERGRNTIGWTPCGFCSSDIKGLLKIVKVICKYQFPSVGTRSFQLIALPGRILFFVPIILFRRLIHLVHQQSRAISKRTACGKTASLPVRMVGLLSMYVHSTQVQYSVYWVLCKNMPRGARQKGVNLGNCGKVYMYIERKRSRQWRDRGEGVRLFCWSKDN